MTKKDVNVSRGQPLSPHPLPPGEGGVHRALGCIPFSKYTFLQKPGWARATVGGGRAERGWRGVGFLCYFLSPGERKKVRALGTLAIKGVMMT